MLLPVWTVNIFLFGIISVAPDAKPAASAFEAHYRGARTLQAHFLEEYREQGRITRSEAGTVYFQKPGKMRWEYATPENTLFLVDGKFAWFYVPVDHTVTRVPAKESSDWRTPLALLAGEMKLSRVCDTVGLATKEKASDPANAILFCNVRGARVGAPDSRNSREGGSENGGQVVLFEVQPGTGELVRVQVKDSGGVVIDFHFKNWQLNPSVPALLFRFSPPPGVAIVNGELPAADSAMKP
jgi:outer membrane lipoprotein carrier protein